MANAVRTSDSTQKSLGDEVTAMKSQTKKLIYLLAVSAGITMAVYFLFPFGDKLLLIARNHNALYEIEHGKEIIYTYIDRGDIRVADEILQNNYELSRFEPIEIKTITWNEDPFSDIYWRFNFYNLEPVRNLLYAWGATGNPIYKDKLAEIITSFIDTGTYGQYSWDLHGAAFRTMTLVDVWWKLHNKGEFTKGELPKDLSSKMLQTLEIHGNFLADPNNYEGAYNHGLDQSVALYLLAVNFPELPNADSWIEISSNRISELLEDIVDEDGVLVENSPYYHFYVLEKFWEINRYLKENDLFISPHFDEKIDKMISYAAYILQPDLNVPTIGASLKGEIKLAAIYKEMAEFHPDLLYVLTKGAEGVQPANLNMQYPVGGQTIMRSGWGKGESYVDQTQLIFDVGNYRTNHSDLDALSFNLFSNGLTLMPDAGLYTYDPGPYRTYFHGTRAHNTVVVDGKDQGLGKENSSGEEKVYAGFSEEGEGYVYKSGAHELYDGVSHKRAMVLIEDSTVLIFDDLKSSTEHTYEQMFHLFPGAEIEVDGVTVVAKGETPEQTVTIHQYITDGVELKSVLNSEEPGSAPNSVELIPLIRAQNPLDGICSFQYKVAVPCYALSYLQRGQNVSYVTAISIGNDPATIVYDKDMGALQIETKDSSYNITINETERMERNIEVNKNFALSKIYSSVRPAYLLNVMDAWQTPTSTKEEHLDNIGTESVTINRRENSLEMIPSPDTSNLEVVRNVNLDLSNDNLYFKIRVDRAVNLQDLVITLSNDAWNKQAEYNLRAGVFNIDHIHRDKEWYQFGLGKGDVRNADFGNWVKSDPTFDWSKIDSIKFTAKSEQGKNVVVDIKEFNLVPTQREPRAVIIFDDGWDSVSDAAKLMNEYGMKGNVAVITGSIGSYNRYLTLQELQALQNEHGWDIVNHTDLHKNATVEYVYTNNLEGYEKDVTDALHYLISNDINSAPNWFVYPHGKTGSSIKNIVGKYYKFARATIDSPESFPFAEPLEVKVFSAYSHDANSRDIHYAVRDAIKYDQTLMLMFHKFSEGSPSVFTEWQLSEFDAILKDIKAQGIKVVTLSELDKENGVPDTEFTVHEFVPQQYDLDISERQNANSSSIFQEIVNKFQEIVSKVQGKVSGAQ
ncbi:heparinase II/III family protein [Candidatus Pacebacteria bacterium]|nr:heparinase II/III family protein [Candidatus Paceibacterota bacterium]